ncbi:MAG: hypothetical protein OSJ83_14280, partial [Clostridia bacterium]|nr:hypothetical protein [Clostridia bacterium]
PNMTSMLVPPNITPSAPKPFCEKLELPTLTLRNGVSANISPMIASPADAQYAMKDILRFFFAAASTSLGSSSFCSNVDGRVVTNAPLLRWSNGVPP